jgi:hypothetical protein
MTDSRLALLEEKIRSRITVNPDTNCWEWTGPLKRDGYGQVRHNGRVRGVHRVVYEIMAAEPVDNIKHLDHLCRIRHCVNPGHLEPVTPLVNTRRGLSSISAPLPDDMVEGIAKFIEAAYRRGVLDGIRQAMGREP